MDIHVLHQVIFDELERQGLMAVDAAALTRAVARAFAPPPSPLTFPFPANPRCVNGACEG